MTFNPALSTSENLEANGLSYAFYDEGSPIADVVEPSGVVIFTGDAWDVRAWLEALAESGLSPTTH